ncbi:cellular tumor antigen p53-like isoform X2 [Watersipora subatra]|uniref:cellular tumor antigen p53-like isoform X2 n=1 Tax=Watersipora subatra TaxID=2589382 RepID=UPI00355C97D5
MQLKYSDMSYHLGSDVTPYFEPLVDRSALLESPQYHTEFTFSNFGGQVPDDRDNMTFTDSANPQHRPPSSLSPSPMSMIPSLQPFGGAYNFQFEFGKQPKDTKSAAWTYSAIMNKLYAQKDLSCPIRFRINADGIAHRLFLRAMPVYTKPEFLQEVVKRCPNHVQAPESANIPHREHFIWCENSGATYVKDRESGRSAVLVPYDAPPAGTPWVTYLFSFKCLNSCVGGPNRRELSIIYTLENANQEVLGRASIDLRICACPGRDRKTEEGKVENQQRSEAAPTPPSSTSNTTNRFLLAAPQVSQPSVMSGSQLVHERELLAMTKRPCLDSSCEVFTLTVKGRRNFELLSKIRDSLEMTEQLVPNNERDRYAEERRYNDAQRHQPMQQRVQQVQAPTRLPQMSSAFNFSSARSVNIKQDVVDSTQHCDGIDSVIPLPARGFDMTDSASTSLTVAEWLQNLSLSAYTDNFHNAGFTSMDQLETEESFTIKDLENMQLTKPTVSLIWKSLQEFRRTSSPQRQKPVVAETVSLPDSQGSSSTTSQGASSSQQLSQNSTVSLASSGSFGRSLLEFTRCSIKLTVTNKKRPADVISATDSSDNERYTSKKHKAMKSMHNTL